tara:strand:- start:15 stop:1235 length:1221 start_codon:yes stop_codon:yes gene_type:complete
MGFIGRAVAPAPISANDVPDLPTSKITSGTFADARISSSSVSQHATSFDDNKIVNDLSTLGLRVHTQENLNASNSNSASFDVFQDSSGITNLTNTARDSSGEYVASITGSLYVRQNISALTTGGSNITGLVSSDNASAITLTRNATEGSTNDTTGSYNSIAYTTGSSTAGYLIADLGASYSISQLILGKGRSHADPTSIKIRYHATQTNPHTSGTDVDFTNAVSSVYSYKGASANLSNFSSTGTADWATLSTNGYGSVCKINGFSPFTARYISYKFGSANFHDANAGWTEFDIYKSTLSANATGSFEGATITASASTSSMGAVITYQDYAGTNTLNTDIVLKLSADNGSNYSTATLTALPDFATGIKMAKVNDLSVTAGTQLKYKIEFANQSGTKEARIRGVSLQY